MLIEILVVGAILMYLYSTGFLDFGNPYAIAISVGIVVVATVAGWAVTHFIARRMVDAMFGFDSWTPRAKESRASVAEYSPNENPALQIPLLERLTSEVPNDTEFSRRLSQAYWDSGRKSDYERERLRILRDGKLTREETCSIYYRLADLALEREDTVRCQELLTAICEKYPDSVEAHNARHRILVIKDLSAQRTDGQEGNSA